ncbi:hypothetical protein MLD52_15095 [Puniceicoccaceae bacterium K14]|nr:hypothetical protein [Puniceicoccaceae bacterium K14]
MNRRNFLAAFSTAFLLAAIALTSSRARKFLRKLKRAVLPAPSKHKKAEELISKLQDFNINEEVALTFIENHIKLNQASTWFKIDDKILKIFLLSTDYIQNGADASRKLNWVTYYSPWLAPCYNPFILAQNALAN